MSELQLVVAVTPSGRRWREMERTHFVYRVFDEFGQLLYVGCTKDLTRRLKQHKVDSCKKPWVGYAHHVSARGPFCKRDALDL